MADNYTRQGQTFRSEDVGGNQLPVLLVGAHVRVYDGVQSLAVTGTAQTLTVPGGATHADVVCEGSASTDYLRYWHGSAPTSGIGVKLKDGELLETAAPSSLQVITGSGTLTCRVEYYHYA